MNKNTSHYKYNWPPKLIIVFFAFICSVFFFYIANFDELPFFIRIILGVFGLLLIMIAIGALINTSVEVDDYGNLTVNKTILWFPFTSLYLKSFEIIKIELNRQVASGSKIGGGSNNSTPRFRIDIIHKGGKYLLEASAKNLSVQAKDLANALDCPMEKIWEVK